MFIYVLTVHTKEKFVPIQTLLGGQGTSAPKTPWYFE